MLVGGVFAAAEIALVSLRESQVRSLAERGRRGQKVAKLAADPNRFLAAVQVGVTLAGFLSAAFGAATLARELAPVLRGWGVGAALAAALSLVVVTVAISYVSLVFSELVPKRLALQRAERFALGLAPLLDRIATLSRPVIWLLSRSTDAVVRLLGADPAAAGTSITQEELRDLVAAHESLSKDERQLIEEVFAAGERQVREVLVPRTEVDFLDAALPVSKAAEIVAAQPHSRYPVVRGSHDNVVGFVHVRDLLGPGAKRNGRVGDVAREVKLLPGTKRVLPALSEMRRERHHLAIVVDEYGGTAGIVTLEDIVEELVGDIRDEYDVVPPARRLRGGDIEVEGLLNLDEFAEATGIELPDGPYETVAGYVVAALARLPVAGDVVEADGRRLTVVEMDGRRVARLRVAAARPPRSEPPQPSLTGQAPPGEGGTGGEPLRE